MRAFVGVPSVDTALLLARVARALCRARAPIPTASVHKRGRKPGPPSDADIINTALAGLQPAISHAVAQQLAGFTSRGSKRQAPLALKGTPAPSSHHGQEPPDLPFASLVARHPNRKQTDQKKSFASCRRL